MCQKQIWPSNAIYILNMPISSFTDKTAMSLYIPHVNSIRSTAIHTFHIGICPEQVYLPHYICISHSINTVVYIQTPHYCTYKSEITQTTAYIYHSCHICARNKFDPQMPYINHICQILHVNKTTMQSIMCPESSSIHVVIQYYDFV